MAFSKIYLKFGNIDTAAFNFVAFFTILSVYTCNFTYLEYRGQQTGSCNCVQGLQGLQMVRSYYI